MKKERVDYLDYAKCIAIMLVIWGHTAPNGTNAPFRVLLYSFHMPLFFLVSGMVLVRRGDEYGKEHWKKFVSKNIMTLLVPYLIWCAIYSNFSWKSYVLVFYGSWEMINAAGTLTSLWFLPCLFVSRVMAELLLMLSWKIKGIPRSLMAAAASAAAFLIGFLLPKISIGYPLCSNVAFMALGFIMLGYAIRNFVQKLPKTNAWCYLLLSAAFGGLLYFGQKIQGDSPYLMLISQTKYGKPAIFFLNSFAGIGAVLSFSIFLSIAFRNHFCRGVRRYMLWVGENTIGIFFVHKPFLQEAIMPAVTAVCPNLPAAGQGLIGVVFALAFASAGCYVINRYVPSLFGKFGKIPAGGSQE